MLNKARALCPPVAYVLVGGVCNKQKWVDLRDRKMSKAKRKDRGHGWRKEPGISHNQWGHR